MHEIIYSIRRILPQELPTVTDLVDGTVRTATDAELLNMDIHRLYPGEDYYSCADQRVRDDETLVWNVVGVQSPGVAVSTGSLRARHAELPAAVAPSVMQAAVITGARTVALEVLAEQASALAEYVGEVDGGILLDLSTDSALLDEARRLVQVEGNGIERARIAMARVSCDDVVEAENLIPHSWHGESRY